MAKKTTGLEHRYYVKKLNDPKGKHDSCWYFVLDPKHDPIAWSVLATYAALCRHEGLDKLSQDIMGKLWDVLD